MESYRQSHLGIRLRTGSRRLLIHCSCWSSENLKKQITKKWIWVSHPQWCLVQQCERMFVYFFHKQKKCTYLGCSVCCWDQGEALGLPPHCQILILCVTEIHPCGMHNGRLGMRTGMGLTPDESLYFGAAIGGIRLWGMLSSWWKCVHGPAINASCNCRSTIPEDCSRKCMGKRENVVAENKVLLFFRPKWWL